MEALNNPLVSVKLLLYFTNLGVSVQNIGDQAYTVAVSTFVHFFKIKLHQNNRAQIYLGHL